MRSILGLFEETKNISIKESKHLGRSNKYLKNISILPDLNFPAPGSKKHDADVDAIKWYYDNKSLSKSFLTKSDDSVKKIYKNFCKENNINLDWKKVKEILKDVHSIVSTLKNKHRRPRPKKLLCYEDSRYNDIIDAWSFSFPSGHTTTAYFLSELISHFFPNLSFELKNIASLIGHSRIENCVHYPSDVLAGQFLGELLFSMLTEETNNNIDICNDFKIKKKDKKQLERNIIEAANSSDINLKTYSELLAEYFNINSSACFKKFLEGYPIKTCDKNKNNRNILSLMVYYDKIEDKNIFHHINASKILNDKCEIRDKNITTSSSPNLIIKHINKLSLLDNPYSKFTLFNLISPFKENNNVIAKAMLLKDTNYNILECLEYLNQHFNKNLSLIKEKYITIDDFFNNI